MFCIFIKITLYRTIYYIHNAQLHSPKSILLNLIHFYILILLSYFNLTAFIIFGFSDINIAIIAVYSKKLHKKRSP